MDRNIAIGVFFMKKGVLSVFSVLLAGSLAAALAAPALAAGTGTAYYVSAAGGDDGNPGTQGAPWQSLAKLSATVFEPGDTVYLKRGEVFEGAVTLRGVGSAADPITLASYGEGDRPHIRGPRDNETASLTIAPDAMGWRILGLEISGGRAGVRVQAGSGANDYYLIEDCYIHDNVNSSIDPTVTEDWLRWAHGIEVLGGGARVSSLTMRSCVFRGNDCDFWSAGVTLADVLLDGCTFIQGLYNSVFHTYAENYDITNCLWMGNGTGVFPAGLTCIIAGALTGGPDTNLVSGNEFGFEDDASGRDGCAYDFEIDTDGVTFVNNFAHNGYGEAMLMMGDAACRDIRIEGNIFYRNLGGTPNHHAELALYGSGSGTIKNNIYELRWRGPFFRTKFLDGGKGLRQCGNKRVDIANSLLATPACAFDPVRGTATLSGPAGAALYYTTDGSVPTQSGALYRGEEIPVGQTTVINCKAFAQGRLPSITCCTLVTPGAGAQGITPGPGNRIFSTRYEASFWNWVLFFVCFGWIWMW